MAKIKGIVDSLFCNVRSKLKNQKIDADTEIIDGKYVSENKLKEAALNVRRNAIKEEVTEDKSNVKKLAEMGKNISFNLGKGFKRNVVQKFFIGKIEDADADLINPLRRISEKNNQQIQVNLEKELHNMYGPFSNEPNIQATINNYYFSRNIIENYENGVKNFDGFNEWAKQTELDVSTIQKKEDAKKLYVKTQQDLFDSANQQINQNPKLQEFIKKRNLTINKYRQPYIQEYVKTLGVDPTESLSTYSEDYIRNYNNELLDIRQIKDKKTQSQKLFEFKQRHGTDELLTHNMPLLDSITLGSFMNNTAQLKALQQIQRKDMKKDFLNGLQTFYQEKLEVTNNEISKVFDKDFDESDSRMNELDDRINNFTREMISNKYVTEDAKASLSTASNVMDVKGEDMTFLQRSKKSYEDSLLDIANRMKYFANDPQITNFLNEYGEIYPLVKDHLLNKNIGKGEAFYDQLVKFSKQAKEFDFNTSELTQAVYQLSNIYDNFNNFIVKRNNEGINYREVLNNELDKLKEKNGREYVVTNMLGIELGKAKSDEQIGSLFFAHQNIGAAMEDMATSTIEDILLASNIGYEDAFFQNKKFMILPKSLSNAIADSFKPTLSPQDRNSPIYKLNKVYSLGVLANPLSFPKYFSKITVANMYNHVLSGVSLNPKDIASTFNPRTVLKYNKLLTYHMVNGLDVSDVRDSKTAKFMQSFKNSKIFNTMMMSAKGENLEAEYLKNKDLIESYLTTKGGETGSLAKSFAYEFASPKTQALYKKYMDEYDSATTENTKKEIFTKFFNSIMMNQTLMGIRGKNEDMFRLAGADIVLRKFENEGIWQYGSARIAEVDGVDLRTDLNQSQKNAEKAVIISNANQIAYHQMTRDLNRLKTKWMPFLNYPVGATVRLARRYKNMYHTTVDAVKKSHFNKLTGEVQQLTGSQSTQIIQRNASRMVLDFLFYGGFFYLAMNAIGRASGLVDEEDYQDAKRNEAPNPIFGSRTDNFLALPFGMTDSNNNLLTKYFFDSNTVSQNQLGDVKNMVAPFMNATPSGNPIEYGGRMGLETTKYWVSRTSPIIKSPVELAIGAEFINGGDLRAMDPLMTPADVIAKKASQFVGGEKIYNSLLNPNRYTGITEYDQDSVKNINAAIAMKYEFLNQEDDAYGEKTSVGYTNKEDRMITLLKRSIRAGDVDSYEKYLAQLTNYYEKKGKTPKEITTKINGITGSQKVDSGLSQKNFATWLEQLNDMQRNRVMKALVDQQTFYSRMGIA